MTSQQAASIFRRGSRTYFYSSLFFPAWARSDVVSLYAFVRTADDFVDRIPQDGAGLQEFVRQYRAAVAGAGVADPIIRDFVALARRCEFDPAWTDAFLESMQLDLSKRHYATMAELEHYMRGSAEVVGLMMARILHLPPQADHSAERLGRAMQYINFLRDIIVDYELGRTYVPEEVLHGHGLAALAPEAIRALPDCFQALVRAEVARYRAWQAEAEAGFHWLPPRAAVAIRSASDMYRWTADRIERQPLVVLERQVRPSVARILLTGARWTVAETFLARHEGPSPPADAGPRGDGVRFCQAQLTDGPGVGLSHARLTDGPGEGHSQLELISRGAERSEGLATAGHGVASWQAQLTFLVRVSRPRFWPYLAGPYLVGLCAGAARAGDVLQPFVALHLLYFLWPANLFLYGVNDLADADTDRFNPKKGAQEHLLRPDERRRLGLAAALAALLGLLLLPAESTLGALFLLLFLALGAGYSLPPLRFKARPVLDSASNVLYAMPGFLGYAQTAGAAPPPAALLGAAAWTAAMHLFSAVPDIAADQAAGLSTAATALGARRSLAACAVLWSVAVLSLVALLGPTPIAWLAAVYPLVCVALWLRPERTARVYWLFPWLNVAAGFVLFLVAAARLVQ